MNYALKIKTASNSRDEIDTYIPMIDFSDKDEAEVILRDKPALVDVLKKSSKRLLNLNEPGGIWLSIIRLDEAVSEINSTNIKYQVPDNIYILNCSDNKIRLVVSNSGPNFNNLYCTKLIRVSVFDRKEDTMYPASENNLVSPFLNYKEMSGDLTYIRPFEETTPLKTLINTLKDINAKNKSEILGFLIEYRDVRTSTIKFVEKVMDSFDEWHESVSITKENIDNHTIDYVSMLQNAPVFREVNSSDDTVFILYES